MLWYLVKTHVPRSQITKIQDPIFSLLLLLLFTFLSETLLRTYLLLKQWWNTCLNKLMVEVSYDIIVPLAHLGWIYCYSLLFHWAHLDRQTPNQVKVHNSTGPENSTTYNIWVNSLRTTKTYQHSKINCDNVHMLQRRVNCTAFIIC